MGDKPHKPIVLVFAGPNGSGKTTLIRNFPIIGTYVNADDLKAEYELSDIEAAEQAECLRNMLLNNNKDFSFETVLSTERNILFLRKAKAQGYEIQCVYVLTCNENINVVRVKARHAAGGHDVPVDKIRKRYHLCLTILPQLVDLCDKILIYDNSDKPMLIFRKENDKVELFPNELWSEAAIRDLF